MAGKDEATSNSEKRQPRGLARFALTNTVFVVSALGAFAYFVSRAAQTSLYSKFAIEPEAVGLGYAETLSRAAPALLVLTLLVGGIVWVILRLWRSQRWHGRHRVDRWTTLVIGSVSCSLLVLAFWMPFVYDLRADDVKNGKPVRPPGLSTLQRLATNPLGLRVVPVQVSWVGATQAPYDFRNEVMYLGRADGIAVFYDPTSDRTVHVPQNTIVVERLDDP